MFLFFERSSEAQKDRVLVEDEHDFEFLILLPLEWLGFQDCSYHFRLGAEDQTRVPGMLDQHSIN